MANTEIKRKLFDIVSLALAVVALVIAIWHLLELKHAIERITKVENGLSTQYLGEYPAYFDRIARLVGGAKRSITILCDFPAYGVFSEPLIAEDYFHSLRKRRPFTNVDVTTLDGDARRRLLDTLFPAAEWSNWAADPAKAAKVAEFLRLHAVPSERVRTRDDLLHVVGDVHSEALRDIFLGKAREVPGDFPIYFWVADCREAIFTIANPIEGGEHGFYTSDRSLIQSLLDIRKRYVKGRLPNGCE